MRKKKQVCTTICFKRNGGASATFAAQANLRHCRCVYYMMFVYIRVARKIRLGEKFCEPSAVSPRGIQPAPHAPTHHDFRLLIEFGTIRRENNWLRNESSVMFGGGCTRGFVDICIRRTHTYIMYNIIIVIL